MKIKDLKIGNIIKSKNNTIEIINIKESNSEKLYLLKIDEKLLNNYIDINLLYEILNPSNIFTHNCAQRLVCGQLGSVASRMALDDNQATTIDGTHKGAGMVKAQGQVTTIQYYFENQSWLFDNWFKKRGLTRKGYEPWEDPNAAIDPSSINLGEDEDISIQKNKTEIDFNGIHREIDNSKDQKFEEI